VVRKVLIVGGGVTGCISAISLVKKGFSVTLCEAKPELGGVLQDAVFDNNYFFSGCQYLSNTESWFNECLTSEIKSKLNTFCHLYGSITDFNGSKVKTEDFAMPVFDGSKVSLNGLSEKLINESLLSRLSVYPEYISSALEGFSRKWAIDPGQVCAENALALQIFRVNITDRNSEIEQLKRKKDYDDVLALSHKKRKTKLGITAALPKYGYDTFFMQLEEYMLELGVDVYKKTPIKVEKNELNGIHFKSRLLTFDDYDSVIWSANPNILLKGLDYPKLDNIYGDCESHFFDVNESSHTVIEPRYYQVFSDKTLITRVFIYSIKDKLKVTVECMGSNHNKVIIEKETQEIISEFNFSLKLNWKGSKKEKRYIFYSHEDRAILKNLVSSCGASRTKIIDAAWLDYGRDVKISKILSQF